MENDFGVNEAASPVANDTNITSESFDSGSAQTGGDYASVSDVTSDDLDFFELEDRHGDSSTSEEGAFEEAEASGESPASEEQTNAEAEESSRYKEKTERRISQLLSQRKEAMEKAQKLEMDNLQMKKALGLLYRQHLELEARHKEYAGDYEDPRDSEIRRLNLQQQQQQIRRELEQEMVAKQREWQAQQRQQMEQEQVEEYRSMYLTEIKSALAKYPGVTPEQLAVAVERDNGQTPFEQLAARIDESNLAAYENRVLTKHKSVVSAPKVTRTRGSTNRVPTKFSDNAEDIVDELDMVLGEDWM